jgi:hypothetical protein
MQKIYRDAFVYFGQSLPVLVIFAAIIEGLEWFLGPASSGAGSVVALTIIAYFFHRHFPFGETLSLNQKAVAGAPPMNFTRFILVSGLILLIPLGIALAVAFTAYDGRRALGLFILLMFPLYLLTLSLFGTALPAAVARDGTWRVAQGLRLTFATMWRLVATSGIVGAGLLAAEFGAVFLLKRAGLAGDNLGILAYDIVVLTLGFLPTILAVAVLWEMYWRSRPGAAAGPGPELQTPA